MRHVRHVRSAPDAPVFSERVGRKAGPGHVPPLLLARLRVPWLRIAPIPAETDSASVDSDRSFDFFLVCEARHTSAEAIPKGRDTASRIVGSCRAPQGAVFSSLDERRAPQARKLNFP